MIYTAGQFAEHLESRGAEVRIYGNRHRDAAMEIHSNVAAATVTFSETGRLRAAAVTFGDDLVVTRSFKRIVDLLGLRAVQPVRR